MLYLYSLLNLSSCMELKDFRQNASASSIDSPRIWISCQVTGLRNLAVAITFRNRPYCRRPKCLRCLSRLRHMCRLRMQAGKCLYAISSIMSALSAPSGPSVAPLHSEDTPAWKPLERLSRIGTRRVSSSNLGRAFAVAYRASMSDRKSR